VSSDDGSLTVRLAANTLVQAVGTVATSLVAFFTFVAITRGLGPEAFGDFTAATVFLLIPVVLADVGLSAALLREISADPERTEPAMRAALPLRALIAIGAIAVGVAVGLAAPFNDQTKVAILIASGGAVLTIMTFALQPVLQAELKMHWAVGANLAGRAVTLALTLGALAAGLGFKSIVAAHVVGIAATFVLHLVAVAAFVPLWPVIDTHYWRRLVGGSVALGLAIALSQIFFRVDAVLLALLRSAEEVGLYGAAYKFVELVVLIPAAAATSVFPPLMRFLAAEDPRALGLVQKAFDVLLAASVPLTIVMLAYPEDLITLAAGSEFSAGSDALRLLAPYALFAFANGLLWRVVMATHRDRLLLWTAVFVLAANIGLNLIFIPVYGFKAAAAIAVITEAAVAVPIGLTLRAHGQLPTLRYLPTVLAATAAMTIAVVLLRDHALVGTVVGATAYTATILALPGTTRDVVLRDLLPAARRAVLRRS
jgi:O-antigen/teichoic acid export membrane protein